MTCGKIRYADKAQARKALQVLRAKRGSRRKCETRPYRCDACGGWHLTSQRVV